MKNLNRTRRFAALVLAGAMLLTSCGGSRKATTMHLKRTEGTVAVSDDSGKNIKPKEDLGLYSGYGVDTQTKSYAWIDLDEVKLTKLDENSEVEIKKEGKALEIEVKSGALFFDITQPLAEDETMNIRTSSMLVGIRGTCGWVTQNTAALLKGMVEITAGEQSATITAGEMAVLGESGEIAVCPIQLLGIPTFVLNEVDQASLDEVLTQEPDAQEPEPDEDTEGEDNGEEDPGIGQGYLEQYREIIGQAESYEYYIWPAGSNEGYRYALFQEEGFPVPTLILEKRGLDRNGYQLFRYNPDIGVTENIGDDTVTRFEFPSHSFINEISYDKWYKLTDLAPLDAWASAD